MPEAQPEEEDPQESENLAGNEENATTADPPAGSTRTHSALHNRLLNQQRSNILLQVLFHHMLNSQRRREQEEALAFSPPPLPDREMPILSHEQAVESNAMCRFCFEGSATEASENALVAPWSTRTAGLDEDSLTYHMIFFVADIRRVAMNAFIKLTLAFV